jgi:flagellar protein FlgJ
MNIKSLGSINELMPNTNTSLKKENLIDDSFAKQLNNILEKKDDKELKKVCRDFEGILLQMMYKEMRATVPKSELVQEDYGKKVYESMMDEKIVDAAVNSGGIGLGDALYKLLKART